MSVFDAIEDVIPDLESHPTNQREANAKLQVQKLHEHARAWRTRLPRWQRELYAYEASDYKRVRRPSLPLVTIGGETIGG